MHLQTLSYRISVCAIYINFLYILMNKFANHLGPVEKILFNVTNHIYQNFVSAILSRCEVFVRICGNIWTNVVQYINEFKFSVLAY